MINYLGNHKQWICDNKIIEFLTGVQGESTEKKQSLHIHIINFSFIS